MSQPENYKFHSTGQFRNVVKNIQTQARFKGLDEDKQPIIDHLAKVPSLMYIGTVKTHGTNASIVVHEDGVISFHSKSKLLGYVTVEGEQVLLSDNAEFCQSMFRRFEGVLGIVNQAKLISEDVHGKVVYPLKISGEWVGPSIQKGVGVSLLPKKTFIVFGLKCGETDQENKIGWLPAVKTQTLYSHSDAIYNVMQFETKMLEIDFSNPEYSTNKLVDATDTVENCCPVAKKLGVEDNLLGEGLVWTPVDPWYCYDSGNWFKTKGKKHSVSKTKSVAAVCPEKLNSIKEFVDYAVTTNRLEQGLGEVGLDQKSVGKFIGWVGKDINKEEGDVLEESNLSIKDVGKYVSTKAREFYIDKLNKDL